jgi:hypothetical protein
MQVKAFGINHADAHIHAHGSGWAEAALVNGVECVGRMKSCPGGAFSIGAKAGPRPWAVSVAQSTIVRPNTLAHRLPCARGESLCLKQSVLKFSLLEWDRWQAIGLARLAQSGRRTAVLERRWIGGSCPNIACMPTKNEISSARVAHLTRHAAQFGVMTGPLTIDMSAVRARKREMVRATGREPPAEVQGERC